jgi:hypothetical protein
MYLTYPKPVLLVARSTFAALGRRTADMSRQMQPSSRTPWLRTADEALCRLSLRRSSAGSHRLAYVLSVELSFCSDVPRALCGLSPRLAIMALILISQKGQFGRSSTLCGPPSPVQDACSRHSLNRRPVSFLLRFCSQQPSQWGTVSAPGTGPIGRFRLCPGTNSPAQALSIR